MSGDSQSSNKINISPTQSAELELAELLLTACKNTIREAERREIQIIEMLYNGLGETTNQMRLPADACDAIEQAYLKFHVPNTDGKARIRIHLEEAVRLDREWDVCNHDKVLQELKGALKLIADAPVKTDITNLRLNGAQARIEGNEGSIEDQFMVALDGFSVNRHNLVFDVKNALREYGSYLQESDLELPTITTPGAQAQLYREDFNGLRKLLSLDPASFIAKPAANQYN